jgi:hypothetical protein
MEETIRILPIPKNDWSPILQGFLPETIQQLLQVYGADGEKVGIVCETVDGKAYINGQPEMAYASLQAAATALIKGI